MNDTELKKQAAYELGVMIKQAEMKKEAVQGIFGGDPEYDYPLFTPGLLGGFAGYKARGLGNQFSDYLRERYSPTIDKLENLNSTFNDATTNWKDIIEAYKTGKKKNPKGTNSYYTNLSFNARRQEAGSKLKQLKSQINALKQEAPIGHSMYSRLRKLPNWAKGGLRKAPGILAGLGAALAASAYGRQEVKPQGIWETLFGS